jgi:hypothetical protein
MARQYPPILQAFCLSLLASLRQRLTPARSRRSAKLKKTYHSARPDTDK